MQKGLLRGIGTALALCVLALGGAGCYEESEDSETELSIHVNLLPDGTDSDGVTIHFRTDI